MTFNAFEAGFIDFYAHPYDRYSENAKNNTNNAYKYIGNMNSKKFHLLNCTWAEKISDKNKIYFKSRDEAIKNGYEPCKVCNP